jgi:hypothetical protein
MKKEMVVLKTKGCEGVGCVEEELRNNGWNVKTIELAKGEPLPMSLENIGGLLILGDNMNVFDQNAYPNLNVYFNV